VRAEGNAWHKRYELLRGYFEDEEAREYAEEMSRVAERKKDFTQKAAA